MKPVTLYSAWFCPFAQRAWIALNYRRVPYELVESLSWHADGAYKKNEDLLQHNPTGLVPTIVPHGEAADGHSRAVHESTVCVELADELAAAAADGAAPPPLLPADPFARGRYRLRTEAIVKECCSPYYRVLVRTDKAERRDAFEGLLDKLREFSAELAAHEAAGAAGPFWGADGTLSTVDVALFPFAWRLYVLETYRGRDFIVPRDDPALVHYWRWHDEAEALPAIASTLPDREEYLRHISKYADGSAQSKVGEAVRAGKPAHEHES